MSNMLYACSIMYKTRLPFVLVFNKIDVEDHSFVIDWMTDFEAFQEAVSQDESYMASMVQSMGLVLEEFYNSLRVVGVSAFTGEGMNEFFDAVDEATKEYETEYKPTFEASIKARQEKEFKGKEGDLARVLEDLSLEKENQ
jgi:GPN-loop GTPase